MAQVRCGSCQQFTFANISRGFIIEPFDGRQCVAQAEADDGCRTCALICDGLPRLRQYRKGALGFYINYTFQTVVVVLAKSAAILADSMMVRLLCSSTGHGWLPGDRDVDACFLNIYHLHENPSEPKLNVRLISEHSGTKECINLAKCWLSKCLQDHSSCQAYGAQSCWPTRLVDVGSADGLRPLRLVTINDLDKTPINAKSDGWAALSYCWGTTPFLQTTSANITALQQSISIDLLPATIRDAIEITRAMGLRYLWVDSLCIIQGTDSWAELDWRRESFKMRQVYQGATVTIAAALASDVSQGILRDRPTTSYHAIPQLPGSEAQTLLGPRVEPYNAVEPLHRRGWTLQEDLLSTRVLKYGTREISWRCRTCTAKESRFGTLRVENMGLPLLEGYQMTSSHPNPNTVKVSDQELHLYWTSMIEVYTSRQLTNISDKLPALEGLADHVHRRCGVRYYAGVWIGVLALQLLWHHRGTVHDSGAVTFTRQAQRRAPSWSWASVDGRVSFFKDQEVVTRIEEYKSTTVRLLFDYSLPFRGAEATLDGVLLRMPTIRLATTGSYYGGYERYLPWMKLSESLKTYLDDLAEIPQQHKKVEEGSPQELLHVWFLVVTQSMGPRRKGMFAGLILLPLPMQSITYKRIGVFEGLHPTDITRFRLSTRSIWLV